MACLARVTAVVGIERESDQLRLGFLSPDDLQTALPDEIGFVHLYRPAHGSLDRRRQAIGVLPDDDVCLFQPQQSLRLAAEPPDTVRMPGLHQRVPQEARTLCGHANLV